LLDICGHIGRFGVLVSIIVGMCVYVMEADERRMKAENEQQQAVDQRKAKHYQAWQVVIAAQGQRSSGGRIDALEDLNRDGISLTGVDISKAYLPGLSLEKAELYGANLTEAELVSANLTEANLEFANLAGANLVSANLDGANLAEAELCWTKFANIEGWQHIKSIKYANIYGATNAPDGFIEWAIEHGAVSIQDEEEWEKLIREKKPEAGNSKGEQKGR